MKKWLGGISDAVDLLLSGPQRRQTGSVSDDREGGPDPTSMWNEWRATALPREFRQGGADHIANGIDTEQLAEDVISFLERHFSGAHDDSATEGRDALVARLDRAIPSLKKGSRGYLAMGREILRRI